MAPKAEKVKSAEAQRLAALRKERAIFPPKLAAEELKEYYYLFWSTGTRAHPRTKVLPTAAWEKAPTGYPFFALFFYCGLCPPFSEFFCDVMNTYGLHLLDFTPNAVLTMAPEDDRLKIAVARIQRLRLAGLTVGAVGADFLRRRIAPLQERRRPAWEFQNAADIMRLRPGLNFNFTVLVLNSMLQELFKYDPQHPEVFRLPRGVVPLCNNSLDRIRALMPLCDSHGIDPAWIEPADDVVRAFFDGLVEVPINADEPR